MRTSVWITWEQRLDRSLIAGLVGGCTSSVTGWAVVPRSTRYHNCVCFQRCWWRGHELRSEVSPHPGFGFCGALTCGWARLPPAGSSPKRSGKDESGFEKRPQTPAGVLRCAGHPTTISSCRSGGTRQPGKGFGWMETKLFHAGDGWTSELGCGCLTWPGEDAQAAFCRQRLPVTHRAVDSLPAGGCRESQADVCGGENRRRGAPGTSRQGARGRIGLSQFWF